MSHPRNEKYIVLAIVIGFVGFFILQILSAVLYPPDFSGDYPIYYQEGVLILQLAGAFLLIALTVIAMKAEEERQILPAAGFTAQAISFGIAIISIFEVADVNSLDDFEGFYNLTVSSNFLYFPSLLLIATYDRFKKWVRLTGFIASFPLLISTFMFLFGERDFHLLEWFSSTGYFLIALTYLFWSWNIYSNYKKGI